MRSIQRGIATSIILILFLVLGIAAVSGYFIFSQNQQKLNSINSFEECTKAGYPIMESYPEQCNTPDGKHFVRELSEEEKKKLIPPTSEPTVSDETANWKTYTSDDKSFSFRYPQEWIYEVKNITTEIRGEQYDSILLRAGIPLTEQQRKAQGYIDINDAPRLEDNFTVIYSKHKDYERFTTDDLVTELISTRAQIDSKEDLIIGSSIPAKLVSYDCQAGCADVLFKNKDEIFDASTGPNASINLPVLKQILSTFEILE